MFSKKEKAVMVEVRAERVRRRGSRDFILAWWLFVYQREMERCSVTAEGRLANMTNMIVFG